MNVVHRGVRHTLQHPLIWSFTSPLRAEARKRPLHVSSTAPRPAGLCTSHLRAPSRWWRLRFAPSRTVRHNSSNPRPDPTSHLNSPPAKLSLKDQLKRLTKEYGRGAVLVYLLFSVLDLPVAFGIVRLFGPERVGAAEHAVLGYLKNAWHTVADPVTGKVADLQTASPSTDVETATVREGIIGDKATHVVAKARDGEATIWTQLALAYAIHKTLFIFVRIPLTVAFTPGIVKWARRRGGLFGWAVGPKHKP